MRGLSWPAEHVRGYRVAETERDDESGKDFKSEALHGEGLLVGGPWRIRRVDVR